MRTTIALDPPLRDKLLELKRQWRAPRIQDVIRRLIEQPPATARSLFEEHKAAVVEVARRHKVRRMIAFGSRAIGGAGPMSDLDIAVSLPKDASLFDLSSLREDLSVAFGLSVDLVEIEALKEQRREDFLRGGVPLYP